MPSAYRIVVPVSILPEGKVMMSRPETCRRVFLLLIVVATGCIPIRGRAQTLDPKSLSRPVTNKDVVALPGTVRSLPPTTIDVGSVAPDFVLPYITLVLKPSARQQAQLDQLLHQQQKPKSSNYHRWLTPEQYADRFGASSDDFSIISAWLKTQGFQILRTARGRNWITFKGTAEQVEATLRTRIRKFMVRGTLHFANTAPVSVPIELSNMVAGFRGLDDFAPAASFHSDPHHFSRKSGARPNSTVVTTDPNTGRVLISHFLTPDDVATIYDTVPVYAANTDGSGQKIAIVGQSNISIGDIQLFRQTFGLPPNDPDLLLVPESPDPGHAGDEFQAAMDVEWAGAVSRKAKITYVFADPSAGGAFAAAQYAIDNNVAPVIAMSYGACEQSMAGSAISAFETELQKANVMGITVIASSGTTGAAACDADDLYPASQATQGLAVNYPASSPEVTAVGGTQFSEGTGLYWNFENTPNGASVLSYVPEISWNDTSSLKNLSASGGGLSSCVTLNGDTCAGGFAKPSWQTANGVPQDGVRDVPDIALAAAQSHDAYVVCIYSNCLPGNGPVQISAQGVAASTAALAGVVSLLNQYAVENGIQSTIGLGNINPGLYALAQTGYPGVFHDITSGNNVVPCAPGTPNCEVVSPTTPNPLPFGFSATTGYDPVTGLGSLDVNNLLTAWSWRFANNPKPTITRLSVSVPPNGIPAQQVLPGTQLDFNVIVGANGITLPTGTVTLVSAGSEIGSGSLINGIADVLITPPLGGYGITAIYSGDSNYSASTSAPVSLFVADFTVSTSVDPSFTVQRGSVVTIPITITPAFPNYTPAISLLCFGAPTESTCSFSPATVQPAGGAVVTTMRIQTTLPTSRIRPAKSTFVTFAWGLASPAFIGVMVMRGRTRRLGRRATISLTLLLVVFVASWLGCSTVHPKAPDTGSQPLGPIPIQVTATTGGSNPIFHTVNLTMTLQ
jgi:subtilase family serine protease